MSFFRIDMGQLELSDRFTSVHCFHCHRPLSEGTLRPIPAADDSARAWLTETVEEVESASRGGAVVLRATDLAVFRNLSKLLLTRRRTVKLLEHVGESLGRPQLGLPAGKRLDFESLPLETRHEVLIRGAWLMADLHHRLDDAVRARAIRYNHLVRDFPGMPTEFGNVARSLLRRKLPEPFRADSHRGH